MKTLIRNKMFSSLFYGLVKRKRVNLKQIHFKCSNEINTIIIEFTEVRRKHSMLQKSGIMFACANSRRA